MYLQNPWQTPSQILMCESFFSNGNCATPKQNFTTSAKRPIKKKTPRLARGLKVVCDQFYGTCEAVTHIPGNTSEYLLNI